MGKLDKFKRASAEKRRAAQHQAVDEARLQARRVDPSPWLRSRGLDVRTEGRHITVRDGGTQICRITRMHDGCYIAVQPDGATGIGDTIALAQYIDPGLTFLDAVAIFADPSYADLAPVTPARTGNERPMMPAFSDQDVHRGRAYIEGRGIDPGVRAYAEAAGILGYTHSGILFVGRDDAGAPRNVTRRAIDDDHPIPRRDLKHSDKRYPPLLTGSQDEVWVVEGGMDALAIHTMSQRQGHPAPTVIISSGANVRVFLENESICEILRAAGRVTVAREIEKDEETQAKTDAAHQRQVAAIEAVTGKPVASWSPVVGQGDDLADVCQRGGQIEL